MVKTKRPRLNIVETETVKFGEEYYMAEFTKDGRGKFWTKALIVATTGKRAIVEFEDETGRLQQQEFRKADGKKIRYRPRNSIDLGQIILAPLESPTVAWDKKNR